ncbi:actin-like ATPase domain-containing protein [Meredithblackwellia eburnea MCA 4105]
MSCCGGPPAPVNTVGANRSVVQTNGLPINNQPKPQQNPIVPTSPQGAPPMIPNPQANGNVPAPELHSVNNTADTGGLSVGIDFGTTFSGVSYASTKFFGERTRLVLNWPGTDEHFRKIPTCIIYRQSYPGQKPQVVSWGIAAKRRTPEPGEYKCEWFKLYLTPDGQAANNPDIVLPPLKTPQEVIVDFLTELWQHASKVITEATGSVQELRKATVVMTVPSAWSAAGCQVMREAALDANIVVSSKADDLRYKERLHIITEPEAAAVHAAATITHPALQAPNSFILCDAGGGTIDTAAYRIVGNQRPVELAELTVRSGGNCGSLFLDVAFEKFIRNRLSGHPVHLDLPSMRKFMHDFADVDKLAYNGTAAEDAGSFRYDCFNLEDDHHPEIGLEMGTLNVGGKIMKDEVFSPTIAQVIHVIRQQLDKNPGRRTDCIIMVGGFAGSNFLFDQVQEHFRDRVGAFLRPDDCDVATVQGAARYGMELQRGKLSVMNVICPKNYMMQVKLPASEQDVQMRPSYISMNNANTRVCDKRLLYLAVNGALMKKNQRLESEFCKYATSRADSRFTAILLVSDETQVFRYTDQSNGKELCRWTVDLTAYPAFQRHFNANPNMPAYIPFMLGLEFDSAEVRGTLLSPGTALQPAQVCGQATFEYL